MLLTEEIAAVGMQSMHDWLVASEKSGTKSWRNQEAMMTSHANERAPKSTIINASRQFSLEKNRVIHKSVLTITTV